MKGAQFALLALMVFVAGCQQSIAEPSSNDGAEAQVIRDASDDGAEVRWLTRKIIDDLEPVCPLTENHDLLEKYAPLKSRYASIVKSAEGNPRSADLAIAEQDVAFDRTTFVVECMEPDQPLGFHKTMESYLTEHLAEISVNLDKLEDLIADGN